MPAKITGDYTWLPLPIRESFQFIEAQVCDFRSTWGVYHHLFMHDQQRTKLLAERLGPLLGVFQNLVEDWFILAIGRLTDKDSKRQSNLSLWALAPVTEWAFDPDFKTKVQDSLEDIYASASRVRLHRHKRIAHYDVNVNLDFAKLPEVEFQEFPSILEKMEALLNLFHSQFEKTTMDFGLCPFDITDAAETTAYKAKAYDLLESEGVIALGEWWRRAEKQSG